MSKRKRKKDKHLSTRQYTNLRRTDNVMSKRKRKKDKHLSTRQYTEIKYRATKTLILSSLKYIRGTW